jgi:hypothetical protein
MAHGSNIFFFLQIFDVASLTINSKKDLASIFLKLEKHRHLAKELPQKS